MQRNEPIVRLGEVLTERQEKPDLAALMMGEIPIIAKIGFNTGTIEYREGFDTKTNMILVKPGDLVVSGINAEKGAIALYEESNSKNCAATIHYSSYSIDKKKADPKFLWFFFRSELFRNILIQSLPNGIKTEVKPFRLLNLEIPLPPLKNQQHIVLILERLMAKIEDTLRKRAKSVEEIETLVATKLTEMLVNRDEKSALQYLGDYVILDNYGTSEKCNDDRSGIPVLRMGNIQNGKLDCNDLKYFALSKNEKERYLLKKGDIVINRTNSAELVGKCAVFNLNEEYAFASYLIRFRVDPDKADPNLIANIINSPYGRRYMFDQRKQMTGQANVNAKKLKSLPLALPPLSEQRLIVAHLDRMQAKVDEVKRLQAETECDMVALVPAVLAKAFG